ARIVVDLFPGLFPAGGIGRYVRDVADALSHLPDAPPARLAYPRNLRARARARYRDDMLLELPRPWWQLRLLYGAATMTHSRFVAERVVAVLGIDPARIVTIPPPLSRNFQPMPVDVARAHAARRFALEGEFILHVGTLEPRKNHERLIDAFERARRSGF